MGLRHTPPLVVKIGGSLDETGRLARALDVIARAKRAVIVVPGGGGYADAIRKLQREFKFNDARAHWFAMGAMGDMAKKFVALNSRFSVEESPEQLQSALAAGRKPVWAPRAMMHSDPTIPATWATTSDALAARLAELLSAPLALLKSVDVVAGATAVELAAAGVVDETFPLIVERARLQWQVFGPSDDTALQTYLASEPDR